MSMQDQNQYNIPAFQRKRSIEARARKFASGTNKRVLIPNNRVEPFPQVVDRRSTSQSYSGGAHSVSYGSGGRRPADAYKRVPVSTPGVRNIASEALGSVTPNAVPKTLFQRIKGRMEHEEELDISRSYEPQSSIAQPALRKMECVGIATTYFEKIQVVVIDLIDELSVGDRIVIEGESNSLFEQDIETMQVNKKDIRHARKGQEIGTKVLLAPKSGGKVWKVVG